MRHSPPRARLSSVLLVGLLSLSSLGVVRVAAAQARVFVEVRTASGDPADGRVTLTSSDGRSYTCTTRAGACHIDGVPGGSYVARLETSEGEAPPRQVMIPPSGAVTLRIASR